jgi:hypothetical protein
MFLYLASPIVNFSNYSTISKIGNWHWHMLVVEVRTSAPGIYVEVLTPLCLRKWPLVRAEGMLRTSLSVPWGCLLPALGWQEAGFGGNFVCACWWKGAGFSRALAEGCGDIKKTEALCHESFFKSKGPQESRCSFQNLHKLHLFDCARYI